MSCEPIVAGGTPRCDCLQALIALPDQSRFGWFGAVNVGQTAVISADPRPCSRRLKASGFQCSSTDVAASKLNRILGWNTSTRCDVPRAKPRLPAAHRFRTTGSGSEAQTFPGLGGRPLADGRDRQPLRLRPALRALPLPTRRPTRQGPSILEDGSAARWAMIAPPFRSAQAIVTCARRSGCGAVARSVLARFK